MLSFLSRDGSLSSRFEWHCMWSRCRQDNTAVSWSLLPAERRRVPRQAAVWFRATRSISETRVRRDDADVRNRVSTGDGDRSFGGPHACRASPFQKLRHSVHRYREFSSEESSEVATTASAKWYSVFPITRSEVITTCNMHCINTNHFGFSVVAYWLR